MKSNQLMNIAFSSGSVRVFHNTKMGSLTDLFSVGNVIRQTGGRKSASLTQFLNSSATKEFIGEIEDKHSIKAVETIGKGRNGGTYACIQLMIYAAEYLSPKFHLEVIDTFIEGKILEWRDVSGDEFKALNMAIDNHLPGRDGKSNKGIYITVSKMLLKKVNGDLCSWNDASADELRYRSEIENSISTVLSLNLVRDWEHLKEIISNIK